MNQYINSMKKTVTISAVLLVCILSMTGVRNLSAQDKPVHYMGMTSVNISPYIPLPILSTAPSISLHTSHGAYFEKSGLYTGVSAEFMCSLVPVGHVSSHSRYYYPVAQNGRTRGYAGVELGVGFDWQDGGPVFFHGAAELGFTLNLGAVDLDLGLRAQFMPPYAFDCFFLPVRIGLVF